MLENRIALITGASRGIGKSIALKFAHHGCTVIGTATTDVGADSITDYLKATPGKGCGMKLNMLNDDFEAFIKSAQTHYGGLEILINNAGMTKDSLLLRMKHDDWNSVLQVNLTAIYRLSKAVLPAMIRAKQGRIINLSSVVGITGNPGQSNYSAAKAGLIAFTKSLAREVASRNITANIIAPGFIETDMTTKLTDAQQQAILDNIPMRRMGTADDIASAALFLASPMGDYITGETIHVNGGMHMS